MKAVNLIPTDSKRGARSAGMGSFGPAHVLVGMLAVAVAFVTIYVLTGNTISERQAKVASLQQEVAQTQDIAARLTSYVKFEQLAQARVQTVREIAAARFDWHAALADLSRVVPANTSLQALVGTVAPGSSIGGTGISTGGLRGDVSAPAFEMKGCTASQDDVARLMSRLRVINGVTRVTLADSQKSDSGSVAGGPSTTTVGSGCKSSTPTFDVVVFFSPLLGAGPTGVTSAAAQASTTSTTGTGH